MKSILFWGIVLIIGIWVYESNNSSTVPATSAHSPYTSDSSDEADRSSDDRVGSPESDEHPSQSKRFDGYTCTVDCSGHEAGYRWAEEHDIDDEYACDTAADHSNSPSFGEGCKAYVNGESDGGSGDDSPDDQ